MSEATEIQISGGLSVDVDSLKVNEFVLVPDANSAEVFLREIFPYSCNYFVVSSDGKFPKDPVLNKRCLDVLKNSEDCSVVIFGMDSIRGIQPKTNKVILMDQYIMDSVKAGVHNSMMRIEMNKHKIISIIERFFRQWKFLGANGEVSHLYAKSTFYNQHELDWMLDLVVKGNAPFDEFDINEVTVQPAGKSDFVIWKPRFAENLLSTSNQYYVNGRLLTFNENLYFSATYKDRPIAISRVGLTHAGSAILKNSYVSPQFRGRGVWKKLHQARIAKVKEICKPTDGVYAYTNLTDFRFKRRGFDWIQTAKYKKNGLKRIAQVWRSTVSELK